MRALAAALLLLAGCGEEDLVGEDRGATANQIERLSTPAVETPDPTASVRLQPLAATDLVSAGMPRPACEFSRDGRVLLAASANDAIARIGGRLLHLAHATEMSASGGFFEDRQISISIGRAAAGARIAVTNRRAEAQLEGEGVWRCIPLDGTER